VTLVLRIENAQGTLANGEPSEFRIERHRLMIGRDDGGRADWRLPDPQRTVSAEHGLVEYRDGTYFLQDVSRNGLFVNGDYQRLAPREHLLVRGDRIIVGPYDIVVVEGPEPTAQAGFGSAQQGASGGGQAWGGWSTPIANPHEIAPAADLKSFGREPPKPVFQSGGAMLGSFAAPPAPAGGDVWGKLFGAETGAGGPPWGAPVEPAAAETSAVPSWGVPTTPEPTKDVAPPVGSPAPAWGAAPSPSTAAWGAPITTPQPSQTAPAWMVPTEPAVEASSTPAVNLLPSETAIGLPDFNAADDPDGENGSQEQVAEPEVSSSALESSDASQRVQQNTPPFGLVEQPKDIVPETASSPSASPSEALSAFLQGAGLAADAFGNLPPEAALAAAGARYRALVEGLVRMMEARARAKHELGVRSTVYAKNPLKFLQGPQAAQALVKPIGVGYLEGGAAVQEAFTDLQAHQIAMMLGMREAVRATVARFGPEAIEKRAGAKGLLGSILPGQRKAQLYEAYEKEWEALAGTSDEAFLDVFAKAFRKAYDEVSGTGT
jgi:type VI secretion system protein